MITPRIQKGYLILFGVFYRINLHTNTMNRLTKFLEKLDLSDIEARLYTTLLTSGPTTVRDLSVLCEMKRTTAYFYIDQLIGKGLVIKITRGTKKLVSAHQPTESIQHLVKEKAASAQALKAAFPSMLQSLSTLPQIKESTDAEIKYYKGKNGVMKIYKEAFSAKELRSYVNIAEIVEVFPENFELFNNAFKNNPELVMYEICEDSPEAKERIKDSNRNHLYKLLPPDIKLSAQDILIYDDKIVIIHFKDQLNGIVLHNIYLYKNFKVLFDFIWRLLPE